MTSPGAVREGLPTSIFIRLGRITNDKWTIRNISLNDYTLIIRANSVRINFLVIYSAENINAVSTSTYRECLIHGCKCFGCTFAGILIRTNSRNIPRCLRGNGSG